MRVKLGLLVVLAIVVATLVAPSSVTAASMNMSTGTCEQKSCQEGHSIPLCCLNAELPLSHCFLSSTVASAVLPSNRLTPNPDAVLVHKTACQTSTFSPNMEKRPPPDSLQTLLLPSDKAFHCRNVLNSEEPALL